jgi:hypothetical protein
MVAGLGQVRNQVTPDDAASQEARSGTELRRWFAAASAVVERRQASARRFARAAPAGADHETLRLPAFRFLAFFCPCHPPLRTARCFHCSDEVLDGIAAFIRTDGHASDAHASREREILSVSQSMLTLGESSEL